LAADTEIDCGRVGVTVTVRVIDPFIESDVALIWVVPGARPEANPAETLATVVLDEFHIAAAVRSWVLLSLYVPVAANCWVLPTGRDGFIGLTAIPANTAGVMVSDAEPLTELNEAVIVACPADEPVASPLELIVATDWVDEVQLTA